MVASRLEGNDVQERFSEGKLKEAIRQLDAARAERRTESTQRPLIKLKEGIDWSSLPLSAPMIAALEYLAEPDEQARRGKRRPRVSTLRALLDRKLIERGSGPPGHVLTPRGREVRRKR